MADSDSEGIDSVHLALLKRSLEEKRIVIKNSMRDNSINLTALILGSSGLLAVSLLVLKKAILDNGTTPFVGAAVLTIASIVYFHEKTVVPVVPVPGGAVLAQTGSPTATLESSIATSKSSTATSKSLLNEQLKSLMNELNQKYIELDKKDTKERGGETETDKIEEFIKIVEDLLKTNPELDKFLIDVGNELLKEFKKPPVLEKFGGGYKPKKSRSKRRTKKSRRNKKSRRSRRY